MGVSTAQPRADVGRVGVLALQGAFAEHIRAFERLGVDAGEVRRPCDLDHVSSLVIPGGESTTVGKLLVRTGLDRAVRERAAGGMPIWGTCAGLILLAADVGDSGSRVGAPQPLLGLMDLRVRRNAFGSQLDSFETPLAAPAVADRPIPAVFIRAPVIEATGPGVEVLACLADGSPVAARQGRLLATAFHPELTADPAFHRYFIEVVTAADPLFPAPDQPSSLDLVKRGEATASLSPTRPSLLVPPASVGA